MTGFVRDWRSRTKESIHLKFELMGANDFRETIFPCLKPKVISEKEFPVFGNMLDWGRKQNNREHPILANTRGGEIFNSRVQLAN